MSKIIEKIKSIIFEPAPNKDEENFEKTIASLHTNFLNNKCVTSKMKNTVYQIMDSQNAGHIFKISYLLQHLENVSRKEKGSTKEFDYLIMELEESILACDNMYYNNLFLTTICKADKNSHDLLAKKLLAKTQNKPQISKEIKNYPECSIDECIQGYMCGGQAKISKIPTKQLITYFFKNHSLDDISAYRFIARIGRTENIHEVYETAYALQKFYQLNKDKTGENSQPLVKVLDRSMQRRKNVVYSTLFARDIKVADKLAHAKIVQKYGNEKDIDSFNQEVGKNPQGNPYISQVQQDSYIIPSSKIHNIR